VAQRFDRLRCGLGVLLTRLNGVAQHVREVRALDVFRPVDELSANAGDRAAG
jgi:hypothetical protein